MSAANYTDEDQIRRLVQTWHAASERGDTEAVLRLLTDDVVFLVPGRQPMFKEEFAALSSSPPGVERPMLRASQDIREILVSGEMAFMWSALSVSITPPGSSETTVRDGHTLSVFRKFKGEWLLARDANLLVTRSK